MHEIMATGSSKNTVDLIEDEQQSQTTSKLPKVHETEITPLLGQTTESHDGPVKRDGLCQMTRIYESIYCYHYWEQEDPTKILIPRSAVGPGALGGVEERWCKTAEVQGKIAMLKGTQQFLECIPGMQIRGFYDEIVTDQT